MAYSLGIDLGTTYSAAATAHDGRIEIFRLGELEATIPSIVLLRADGEVLVGDEAERRSLNEPTRTAREFKRRLGDPTPITLGGSPYGAEALLAHLLKAIVATISKQSGDPPDAIVLTHPASYGAHKLDLLHEAIRQADLENVTLLTDAEAAAVHETRQRHVPTGAVVAVYDFGGGTFDATVLRKTEDGFEQIGRPESLDRLGGTDFDEALFTSVVAQVRLAGLTVDPDDPATLAALARLRDECIRAKEALSSDTDTAIQIVLPGLRTELPLTRDDFEGLLRPRIGETVAALQRAVESAGFGFEGVDRFLLVGESSRIPLVAAMVREATGRPIVVDADPKHAVALGAAFVAEQRRLAASTAADTVAAAAAAAGTGTILAMEAAAGGDVAGDDADAVGSTAGAAEAEPAGPAGSGTFPPTEVTPVAMGPGSAVVATGAGRSGRRRMIAAATALGAIALVLVLGAVASGMLTGASSSPSPSVAEVSAAPSVSTTFGPAPSTTPAPTPSSVPSASAIPSATATPAGRQARITGISVTDGRYIVDYEVFGFEPALPGQHMHFFFDTVPPVEAGVPGAGPWFMYAGPMPFTGYKVSDRPSGATRMCVLVANADYSVVPDTGNCMILP